MQVSAYDQVASLLLALLILFGFVVFVLVLLWLARRAITAHRPVEVQLVEEYSGRGDHAIGLAHEMEEPGVKELADVQSPQLADTLAAVTTAVTMQQATLEEMIGNAEEVGRGAGRGDRRAQGPAGEGQRNVVPRWERWEIRFTATSVSMYARQLDHFGIELGALGGGRREVDYAANLAAASPTVRTADAARENRLRFSWKSGTLQQFDRQLLEQAGIDVRGRIVAQFYPEQVEDQLARLELAHAAGRSVAEIRKTVFGVQSAGGGRTFFVVRQEYRAGP